MNRIDGSRRRHSPRWAVCCWIAALHAIIGRGDNAEVYMTELMGLVFEGWAVNA